MSNKEPIVRNAVTCGICQSPADRYDYGFQCQANPGHMGDLNVGIFSDLTYSGPALEHPPLRSLSEADEYRDRSLITCLKLSPGKHDQPTLCRPESVEHGLICAYMIIEPHETSAQVKARLDRTNELSLTADRPTLCGKCLNAVDSEAV